MKALNLYAGIGGNRKLWTGMDITAVELNPEIARFYKDHFPQDTVLIEDAHDYLLKHYKEFDFIWTSPPCPTHSRARFWSSKGGIYAVAYPEMSLYQEIILLKKFFKGLWVAENVKPYYKPLIEPNIELSRHLFWANFAIQNFKSESNYIFNGADRIRVVNMLGFILDDYKIPDKTKALRNCVNPELGLHILNCALQKEIVTQKTIFDFYESTTSDPI